VYKPTAQTTCSRKRYGPFTNYIALKGWVGGVEVAIGLQHCVILRRW